MSTSMYAVAKQAGLTRGAVLYYYLDVDSLVVDAHAAGVARFCGERDARIASTDGPRRQLDVAITAGLPTGPTTRSCGCCSNWTDSPAARRCTKHWCRNSTGARWRPNRGIISSGRRAGVFSPTISDDSVATTMVALEDGYGMRIVADRVTTHAAAADGMPEVAEQLGCPTADA